MHRHDRLRALREPPLDVGRVEVERERIDVGEHRNGIPAGNRLRGRVERECGADHLVALTDAQRVERDHERVGSVGDADRLLYAEVLGGLALESLDLGPEDEATGFQHSGERFFELRTQRRVLRLDVNVRNRRHGEPW
jgi:hypothetical protein